MQQVLRSRSVMVYPVIYDKLITKICAESSPVYISDGANRYISGPSCSKLTMSLVNDSLKIYIE